MLGREVIEGQQLVAVLDQALRSLWVFRLEAVDEQIEGGMCVLTGFRLPDVVQHFLGFRLGPFGKVVEYVASFVHPTALLSRGWKDLLQCGPEPHSTIACGQFRSGEAPAFEVEEHFPPTLGTFPDAVLDGEKMLFAACIDANDDQQSRSSVPRSPL